MQFGQQVLSHPLLVEAIENEFVPVVIHNNKKGRDAKILARYREKSWNNPVVRFVDAKGKDLIPRQGGVYSVAGIARRMAAALRAARWAVPRYLQLLEREAAPRTFAKASFAMF